MPESSCKRVGLFVASLPLLVVLVLVLSGEVALDSGALPWLAGVLLFLLLIFYVVGVGLCVLFRRFRGTHNQRL